MAMLDEVLTIGFESDTEWPEEVKNAQYVKLVGGSPSFDPHTKTITITVVDPGSVPQWRTLVATDFSSLDTTTFSADGSVTIDGHSWTVADIANRFSGASMGITNGKGLRLPSPGTSQTGTARLISNLDVPRIRFPLPSNIINNVPVRASFQMDSVELGGAVQWYPTIGFIYPSSTRICGQTLSLGPNNGNTAAANFSLWRQVNGAGSSAVANTVPVATGTNIGAIWAPHGVGACQSVTGLTGISSSMSVDDINGLCLSSASYGSNTTGSTAMDPTTRGQAQNWAVYLAACTSGAYSTHCYISRFRLEAFY